MNCSHICKLAGVILLLGSTFLIGVCSRKWFVSHKGIDGSTCGAQHNTTCRTLTYALLHSASGDTLFVDASSNVSYYECQNASYALTLNHSVTIKGINGVPVIECHDKLRTVILIINGTGILPLPVVNIDNVEAYNGLVIISDAVVVFRRFHLHNSTMSTHTTGSTSNLKITCRFVNIQLLSSRVTGYKYCIDAGCVGSSFLSVQKCLQHTVLISKTMFTNGAFFVSGQYSSTISMSDTIFDVSDTSDRYSHGSSFQFAFNTKITVANCTFKYSRLSYGASPTQAALKLTEFVSLNQAILKKATASVRIHGCRFENNNPAIVATGVMNVTVEECDFRNNTSAGWGGAVSIQQSIPYWAIYPGIHFLERPATWRFVRCNFIDNKATAKETKSLDQITIAEGNGGAVAIDIKGTVSFQFCSFINNTAEMYGGNIFINDSRSRVILTSSHLTVSSKNKHTLFGELIYSQGNLILSKVTLETKTAINGLSLLHHEQRKGLWISNMTIHCPIGSNVYQINASQSKMKNFDGFGIGRYYLYCRTCDREMYSVTGGSLMQTSLVSSLGSLHMLFNKTVQNIECYDCPYGGRCIDGVVTSRPNFCGFRQDGHVKFLNCPPGYCCADSTKCENYNSCEQNRKGFLCGQCRSGYYQDFLSGGKCLANEYCRGDIFWSFFSILGLCYWTFFFFKRNLENWLKRFLNGFVKTEFKQAKVTLFQCTPIQENLFGSKQQSAMRTSTTGMYSVDLAYIGHNIHSIVDPTEITSNSFSEEPSSPNSPSSIAPSSELSVNAAQLDQRSSGSSQDEETDKGSGLADIIFYFLQVATLLNISAEMQSNSSSKSGTLYLIGKSITRVFNFDLTFFNGLRHPCPFPSATATDKQFVKFGLILYMYIISTVLYFIWKLIKTFICYLSKRSYTSKATNKLHLLLKTKFLAALIPMFTLTYQMVAETSFSLLHCVPTGDRYVLFINGEINCLQIWQYAIIVFLIGYVIPFPLALFVGHKLLRSHLINLKSFFIACLLPLPMLVLWLSKKLKGNLVPLDTNYCQNENDNRELSYIMYDLENAYRDTHSGPLAWKSVPVFRRLLLILVAIIVHQVLLRLILLLFLCTVFLWHHVYMQPYFKLSSNLFDAVFLILLVIIASFNLVRASFIFAEANIVGFKDTLVKGLSTAEFTLVTSPVVLAIVGFLICIIIAAMLMFIRFVKDRIMPSPPVLTGTPSIQCDCDSSSITRSLQKPLITSKSTSAQQTGSKLD